MDENGYKQSEDAERISRAQDGDVEAFGDLYQKYLNPIYRYIRVRVAESRTAEDLTEAVFLRSFEALGDYEERGLPFSAFLFKVTRNLLVDHYRQQKDEAPLETAERVTVQEPALDEQLIEKEATSALREALSDLPPDYQDVIRLRVLLSMPTATVADWMNRSEGAIRVLLHRALKNLREHMSKNDE
jgi:RNA polymerase sigma-70 factor (ECF subfamily)